MQCPSCGLQFDQPAPERCPRCGYVFAAPSAQPPQYNPYSPYPPSTSHEPPAGSGAPQNPPSYNPQGQYGGYAPPSGYGQPAPPSGYGQPYGQAAPPSYPLAPGYPPASYAPSGYPPQGYPPQGYPQGPLAPLPARKKSRTGLVIGIVAAVVIVLAACTGGTIWAMRSLGQTTVTTLSGTPSASASPTASETVIYGDTFKSDDEGWLDEPGHCFLKGDGYHVTNTWACYAPIGTQTDVDISVTTQQVGGPTTWPYGIIFRRTSVGNSYQFMIDSNGKWVFYKCVNDTCTALVDYTANASIRGGLNTPNALEVRIAGSHFDFYVNNTKVGSSDDTTFTSGKVGLVASKNVDSVFTNFVVSRPN